MKLHAGLKKVLSCNILIFLTIFIVCKANIASGATVDVLVVYDTTAASWVASNGGINTFSADVINRLNQALQNSGLTAHSFRLAGSMTASYTTTSDGSVSLTADLGWVAGDASVNSVRNTTGADLVAMMVDTGSAYGYVGIGNLLTNWGGSSNAAFSVNAIQAVDTGHTLTHEIGHNLGAHHSKNQTSSPGPNIYLDNQYSAGWYFTGTNTTNYHTIMAYNYDGNGNYYTEAPLFSTPTKIYQGTTSGNALDGNNARVISETIATVAAYRTIATATVPLGEAVDSTSLSWTTSGNANWFGQTSTAYYGADAAQSGDIGDSHSSNIQTTVSGPGSISFYWKVSSETNWDYMRFYIDGVEQSGSISGSTNWAQKSFSITGNGSHTLKWSYTKDGSVTTGSDCGWVDKVVWSPDDVSLTGITISGQVRVNKSSTAKYRANADWSYGPTSDITSSVTWSENSIYASIDSRGVLTTTDVENDQVVTISASYDYDGSTRNDTHAVTIKAQVFPWALYMPAIQNGRRAEEMQQ